MPISYLNGQFYAANIATVDLNDRGMLLGDGIFETIRAINGSAVFLDLHWQRFNKSAEFLNIPLTLGRDQLSGLIYSLLEQNDLLKKTAWIRITLTRGAGERGLLPGKTSHPTLFITCGELTYYPPQMKVCVTEIRRNIYSPLSQIKSLNYLDNILARQEAAQKGADEALLLNTNGELVCGSSSNLFVVLHDQLYTAAIKEGVLPGTTRQVILKIANKLNIPINEQAIKLNDLCNIQGMFLTNALMGMCVVNQCNGVAIQTKHPIIEKLQIGYGEELVAQLNSSACA